MYRCGYCGKPTDKDGIPLPSEQCENISQEELDNAELVHGECCREQYEPVYVVVTRDMALDAGDPSLEGELWVWDR